MLNVVAWGPVLPPASVLLDPVTCVPSWFAHYRAISNKTLTSGYVVDGAGNVPAAPAALAQAAGRKLAADTMLPADVRARGARLTLDAYTLARNMTSEVGTSSVGDAIAVGQATVNRAALGRKTVTDVAINRQAPGHANRGFYGPINVTKRDANGQKITAPFGRWTATTKDPTVRAIALAQDILDGVIPADFNKGGDDQANLTIYKYPARRVRELADEGAYWVGQLPGVNHRRTMVFRKVQVNAPTAATLLARGIAALDQPSVDWAKYPVCAGGGLLVDRNGTAVSAGTVGAIAPSAAPIIGAAVVTTAAMVGAAVWRRRRMAVP